MTKPFNLNSAAFVAILTLTAAVNVNAQTPCPTGPGDITVSASCNTGIALTGNQNLTIGTPPSAIVVVTGAVSGIVVTVTGTGNTINITSSGSIDADDDTGIQNRGGTITTLTNAGTIDASGEEGQGIYNDVNQGSGLTPGVITTLNNTGTITVGEDGYGIKNNASIIETLNNAGNITLTDDGIGITNEGSGTQLSGLIGTITTLNNSGSITLQNGGVGISNEGRIITLNNSGDITTISDGVGIANDRVTARIDTLNNSGTITGGEDGIQNVGIITTFTNFGAISFQSGYGINNSGTITTLNNAQGGIGSSPSTPALTYSGSLPTYYNIIIRSPTEYGQLAVFNPSGFTTFGIFTGSTVRNGIYAAVLSGVTLTEISSTTTGSYGTGTWELRETAVGSSIWDLFLAGFFSGPTTADTQQSLVNTAAALQSTYALQNAVLANSFSYDCSVFGANNVCVSAGGRNTAVSASNGLNNTSALLIAAYRIKPTLRIGAYADQNLSVSNAGSTVNLGNNTPLIGLFGVWNERLDGTGTEVKVSAAYGQKNTTVNRQVVGTSEAGSGSSNLNSQGAQITAKYGFAVAPEVLVSPYVGLRYTQNNMGGYTEATSATVTAPLTYSALNTNATTALAGVTAAYRFIPKATAFASAGVETDTNTSGGTYSASGVTGLTPVNFNPNPVRTRPTATVGAYYDIVKNQRIGITGIYRQESYQAISTTTVMATYTIGL